MRNERSREWCINNSDIHWNTNGDNGVDYGDYKYPNSNRHWQRNPSLSQSAICTGVKTLMVKIAEHRTLNHFAICPLDTDPSIN